MLRSRFREQRGILISAMYTHCEIGEYIIASGKLDAGITRESSQFSEYYNGAKKKERFKK